MTGWPPPSLRHVARLTDALGIVEHAHLGTPRRELGYCTDDAGRALALAARLPLDPESHRIATVALRFLEQAHEGDGQFRLRLGPGGWTSDPPSDDASGRALLGLGTAACRAPWPAVRAGARRLFDSASGFRSPYPRAVAYAALGAVEVQLATPQGSEAAGILEAAAAMLDRAGSDPGWPWPEPRLTYANALLPAAALAVARATGREDSAARALHRLDWLVQTETRGTAFSFTPVAGRAPFDTKPAFDQQPIEAWAMAEACAAAYSCTGDPRWASGTRRAARWFLGDNDPHVTMFDPVTGGGFDGLQRDGVNLNQGAESSLAFVATMLAVRTVPQPGLQPTWPGPAVALTPPAGSGPSRTAPRAGG